MKRRKVKKYNGKKPVKLLNRHMNHYGFQWQEGLNVLSEPFNDKPTCGSGGLYYCTAENVGHHVCCMRPKLIADVSIPGEAKTVDMSTNSKSDRVILSNIRPFDEWSAFDDEEFITSSYLSSKYINFKYVPKRKRTKEIFLSAVKKNGFILAEVPEKKRTKELCLTAVKQNGRALKHVPQEFLTEDICLEAMKHDPCVLKYLPIHLRTKELCLFAVNNGGAALRYVPDKIKTKEICLAAMKHYDGDALYHLPEVKKDPCKDYRGILGPTDIPLYNNGFSCFERMSLRVVRLSWWLRERWCP